MFLPGQLGIGIIGGIGHVETACDRRCCAPRRFSLNGSRVSSPPTWHRTLSASSGSPPPAGHALQLELRVIAVGDGAAFDGNESGGAVAQLLDAPCRHRRRRPRRSSTSTSRSLYCPSSNSGRTSNDGAEFQRAGFREVDLVDLRLRDRHQLLSFTACSICSGTSDCSTSLLMSSAKRRRISGDGGLARAKPGNARDARKFLGHAFDCFLHVFGGNFQFQFAPASCFSHGSLGAIEVRPIFGRLAISPR